ncbi:terpenoid synthase [Sanghuangporus baumii]|uniref:Terpene synthase n=1 Tax=Sanghuangporus baumii TaxID=108892 RepID=A0A9Q5I3E1_SANBA|nr:terpenoid synthase [Sanghuangporus baumii]
MEYTVKLPDMDSLTPFTWVGCNPHYSRSDTEATDWMLSYGVLSGNKRASLIKTNPDKLMAYTYPYADPKSLRLASDYAAILFALDEFTDDQSADEAKATRDIFSNALSGRSGDDASPITLFTKDFLERFSSASEELRARFVTHCIGYIDATAREAGLRATGQTPSFEDYVQLRRQNGGLFPAFEMVEFALGFTLPAGVLEDNDFQNIVFAAMDIICMSNDIYSFKMEYASGNDFCNAVSSLMHDNGLSQQAAVDRAGRLYKQRCDDMISSKKALRSFGAETDEMIRKYVWALEQWITGYNVWQLETTRFFGDKSKEVNSTGIVKISHRKAIRVA